MRNAWVLAAIIGFAGAVGAPMAQAQRFQPQYGPGPGQGTISCGSSNYRLARCALPRGWRTVQLVQQTSDSACVYGQTWGSDRGSVWVDRGCAGVFAARRGNGGWQPGPGWNQDFTMSCGSPQYQYNFCQVDVGGHGHVRVRRQISDRRCELGRNWGWNRAGIWVDKGCSAQFIVARRW